MDKSPFRYFKTSPEIIRLAVMMYVRFPLSLRNVEDLLHERGIEISHETVRYWWNRFGPMFAGEIRKRRSQQLRHITQWRWHLDEIYVKINGVTHYLWRAVDHEGEVLVSYVTKTRDKSAAMKEIGNIGRQQVGRHLNNRAENSHLPFRRRERAMSRFRRMSNLQKFVSTHVSFYNHFNLDRHLNSISRFKPNRDVVLLEWRQLLAA